jgi:adenylate cyclase
VYSLVWFGLFAGLGGLVNILFWQICKSLFIYQNFWIVAVYPEVSAGLSSVLMLLVLFGIESAERRKTTTQMGRFLSPAIVDEILAHPEEEYPRSRRTTATVIFTDLEGFTTYSENHEPEEVVETLNHYMTRMVPIVREYGGEVDKYIGDAIMGFFGVPVPRYDHAARALLCAIAMQDECARFREETGIAFYMRIGIHTGDVIAGCMGSEDVHCEHLNYTVIGDTVNLASRLESKNKEFSSWIMCSAATYEAAPDIVEVEAASTQIKGKSQAVDVLIVRGLKGDPDYDKRWGRQLPAGGADETLHEAEPEAAKALEAPVLALPSGESENRSDTEESDEA